MKTVLMIICLLSITTVTFAQGQRSQGQRSQRQAPPSAEEMIKRATEQLSLTDAQVVQWEEIHAKYEDAMADRSKAQSIRTEMEKELEATLTEEQLELFKERKNRQRPPRGRN